MDAFRFSKPDRDIVVNSLINNTWGAEQRSRNVLEPGRPFSIRILILKDYYKVQISVEPLSNASGAASDSGEWKAPLRLHPSYTH